MLRLSLDLNLAIGPKKGFLREFNITGIVFNPDIFDRRYSVPYSVPSMTLRIIGASFENA
jgi:hypothetical protein